MSGRVSILIVDDRPENLVALEHVLDQPGWRVVRAQSGNEALALAQEEEFALVLMDVQMPDMNGFETAQLMRLNPRTRSLPIIFVTAIGRDEKYLFEGYESGAVDYLPKPIDPVILVSKVRVFAELYLQRRALEESRRDLAVVNQSLAERNQQLQDELALARTVQMSFLPRCCPRHDRLEIGQYYLICSTLGGDLFDVFALDDRHVVFYMADVSGHGVGAALYAGLVKMSFESMKNQPEVLVDPARALGQLNSLLHGKLENEWFVTVFCAVLDLETNRLRWSNAGHPPPWLIQAAGGVVAGCGGLHGPGIGLLEDAVYLSEEMALQSGDLLVLYTDGITEAMHAGEEFGEERLRELLQAHAAAAPEALINAVAGAVERHRNGSAVSDDCSLLALKLL